jgi:hypothetical protein
MAHLQQMHYLKSGFSCLASGVARGAATAAVKLHRHSTTTATHVSNMCQTTSPEALCVCLVSAPALVADDDRGPRLAGSHVAAPSGQPLMGMLQCTMLCLYRSAHNSNWSQFKEDETAGCHKAHTTQQQIPTKRPPQAVCVCLVSALL